MEDIDFNCWKGCDLIEEITIPQTGEELKPEAFLACTNLLEIQLPYLLTEIDSSCFMDCRNLKKVSYSDESGNATSVNDIITIIKDHAFTSCINLVGFTRPNSLIRVCQSAFQGCTSITSFFFPANPIVIEKFAFADCAKLSLVYLDKTTQNIENYAFSDSNSSLNFYTNATSVFKFNGSDRNWRLKYLASNKTDAYTINTNQSQLLNDYDFPDLIYQINETPAVINAQIYNKYALTKVPERYATIFGYTCYELNSPNLTVDGYITIPDKVKGTDGNIYTVRILNSRCFSNHEELKGVTFNENLVQIKDNAFDGSLNIETFNFDNCKELKEIGSYALGTSSTEVTGENVVCTSLTLPNSLEIIRSSAFRNFTHANYLSFKTNESECSNLKLIDEYAFYRFGYRLTEAEATCDIVLPCSLNDKDARTIKNISSQLAIYKNAFRDAKSLRSVTMETCSHNVPDHINNDESFGSNAFQSCTYLKNFTASETLYKIGSQFFWNDYKLEDIKLHTRRAWLRTKDSDGNPVVKDPWSNAGRTNTNNTWLQHVLEVIF